MARPPHAHPRPVLPSQSPTAPAAPLAPRGPRGSPEQRARIVDAARELFGVTGFEQVTMADVAAKAGVVRATVFNYFPSKHALVEAITGDVVLYWDGMLERALASESTPVPTLVRALFDHMGFGIEQYHGFYKGVFREIMKMRVGLEEGGEVETISWRAFERLTALLARGQERGEITRAAHPADLAAAFDALSNGTIHHWLFDGTEGSLRERMNRAAEIFLGPVATGPAQKPGGPVPDLLPLPTNGAPRALVRPLTHARRAQPRRTRR